MHCETFAFLQIVVFIDDLNMPEADKYGAQPPLELIRQLLDLGGVYDTEKVAWKVKFMFNIVETWGSGCRLLPLGPCPTKTKNKFVG